MPRHLAAAPLFSRLSGARHRGAVDGRQQVDLSGGQEPTAAPLGACRGLVCEIRSPAMETLRRSGGRGRAWRDGLVRDPRFCRGAEGQGPDANRHLRRAGLERDHASVGTIDC